MTHFPHLSAVVCQLFLSRESGMEEIKASDQVKSHQMQISIPKCSVTRELSGRKKGGVLLVLGDPSLQRSRLRENIRGAGES